MSTTEKTPTTASERPVFDRAWALRMGVAEHDVAQVLEEMNHDLDRLERRGPIHFSFPATSVGNFRVIDNSQLYDGEVNPALEAQGEVEISTYVDLDIMELHHPPAEVLRNNPLQHVPSLYVLGGNNETLAAWASNSEVTALNLHAEVTEADVVEARAEYEVDVTMIKEEMAKQLQAGEIEEIPPIEEMISVPVIRVGGEPLTDEGIAALFGHPSLDAVALTGGQVTDARLGEVLASMPQLAHLRLKNMGVTGEFVGSLPDCKLEGIQLIGPEVSGSWFSALPEMPSITYLTIVGPKALEGLNAKALARAFPNLDNLTIGSGEGSQTSGPDESLFPVIACLPRVEINGLRLSTRAIAKWAAKRGLQLPE